jgi:hypothetical protein
LVLTTAPPKVARLIVRSTVTFELMAPWLAASVLMT